MRRISKEVVNKQYLDKNIGIFNNNGVIYFKGNDMATPTQLANWKRSNNTERYMNALQSKLCENYIVCDNLNEIKDIQLTINTEGKNGGTWIHEKLVLHLARYIDVELELWCDEQIQTLFREGTVSIKQQSTYEKLADIFNGADENLLRLSAYSIDKKKELENKNKELGYKNTILVEENKQLTGNVSRGEYIGLICGYVGDIAKTNRITQSDVWTTLYKSVPTKKGVLIHTYYLNYKKVHKDLIKMRGIKLSDLNSGINCVKHLATDEEIKEIYLVAKRIVENSKVG